jgi:GntR family transcriptional regulator
MDSDGHNPLHLPPISPAGNGPLYTQIIEAIRREIAEGRLAAGAPLPSFRALAEQLRVSLITVKRAYEELEQSGLIFRKQGLGTFVAEHGPERGREARRQEAIKRLREAVQDGLAAGVELGRILREVEELADAERIVTDAAQAAWRGGR